MVDRQDIDALLVSALYGELTPADEARLTAHLESHPADRSALGLLTETRAQFRASGLAAVQVDPPQAISALLLQEAARRAPKRVVAPRDEERAGWFARFVQSFARHPAMAAAAMLVIVAGVGGLLYSRQGSGSFAEQTTDELRASAPAAGSAAPALDQPTAPSAADSFKVDLDDHKFAAGSGSAAPSVSQKPSGIVVNTPAPEPKELETDVAKTDQKTDKQTEKIAAVPAQSQLAARKGEAAPAAKEAAKQAPDPAMAMPETRTNYDDGVAAANAPGAVGGGTASATVGGQAADTGKNAVPPTAPPKATTSTAGDAALLAWARDQHKRVTELVRANNCAEAARIASTISARANDYYNTNVANDRAIKACLAYINEAREKDAERASKARAQKKVDANEVQPAPANIAK